VSEPLTILEEKLAEAHGAAIAATTATEKVEERTLDAALRYDLETMRDEARETRARCLAIEGSFGAEKANDMRAHANATSEKLLDMAGAWFKAGTSPLAAWTFLAMGEAGEVAAWTAIAELARATGNAEVEELVHWALPVQQRHLETALAGGRRLAVAADPVAPRWG